MRRIIALSLMLLALLPVMVHAGDIFQAASAGDVAALTQLLDADPKLIDAKLVDARTGIRTPLYLAIMNGSVDAVKLLLERGADPNVPCEVLKRTPLHLACLRLQQGGGDYVTIIKLLLEKGAKVDAVMLGGQTPLHMVHDVGVAALLIEKGADVNAKAQSDLTPLFGARTAELVKLLVEKGADLKVKETEFNRTPLYAQLYSVDSAKILLDHGADINVRDRNGMTPLFIAGAPEVVALLVARGADVNARDQMGRTPLFQATTNGNTVVAQALIDAGADVKACMANGTTLLHAAVATDRGLDIAKLLLQKGLDINTATQDGFTPLLTACNAPSYATNDFLEWLVANGADVKAKTKDGRTALHLAAANDMRVNARSARGGVDPANDPRAPKYRKTAFLLKHGLDVNAKDDAGNTPLYYTMQHYEGCLEDEIILLDAGADPNNLNAKGYSPLCGVFLRDTGRSMDRERLPDMVKLLLDKGADPNLTLEIGVLMGGVQTYDYMSKCIALVTPKLKNIDIVDRNGRTPLFAALNTGDVAVVKDLLEKGANVNIADRGGFTPLMQAISLEIMQLLLEHGARVDAVTNYKQTVLHALIRIATPEMVALLLEKGIDPNAQDMGGVTAVQYGIGSINNRIPAYTYLFEHGAKGDVVDKQGNGLVHNAAERGKRDLLDLVIKYGADPNLVNKEGNTPLHLAGTGEVITCLLEHNADPQARNALGETPLHRIVRKGYLKADDLQPFAALKIDVNIRDNGGATPLHWAATPDAVKFLLNSGADIKARDNAGATPLHYIACDKGSQGLNTDTIKTLIAAGIDPNSKDNIGETPLHWAARRTRERVIPVLVAAGADVNARNAAGKTPLTIAREAKMPYIADIIVKAGGTE